MAARSPGGAVKLVKLKRGRYEVVVNADLITDMYATGAGIADDSTRIQFTNGKSVLVDGTPDKVMAAIEAAL
jgi:hypothetical protein